MHRATLELFAALDRASATPLRSQLEAAICDAIAGGGLRPGARLPASRVLAEALHVSRGVVSEAYAQIAAEGWIEVRHGSAPVVREVYAVGAGAGREGGGPVGAMPAGGGGPVGAMPAGGGAGRGGGVAALAPRLDLRATAPDLSAFPRRAWSAAARRVLAELPDAALDYGDPYGDEVLRAELAAYLVRVRGAAAAPERLVITSGYTQGLWLACRALAARGARRVAVEDPSLDDAWATIRAAGLEVTGVPVDTDGACVDALGEDVDAVLVTPAHQFPTGAVLAPERRRALLEWAERGDRLVLEDDYDSEYRYDRAPIGTLQRLAPERVVYLGTASKTLAPALRLGWMLAPAALAAEVAQARWAVDSGGPALTGRVYARLLATGEIDRHLRRTRREYRARRDRLVELLAERLPACRVEGVAAGLHLLLRLPARTDDAAVVAALERRRVHVRGLASYRLAAHEDDPALVLGYGRVPLPSIAAAVDALRDALDEVARGADTRVAAGDVAASGGAVAAP